MMKRLFAMLCAAALFTLCGCGEAEVTNTEETPQSAATPAVVSETPEVSAETGGTLIAYFSWSGHTAEMAEMIQQETGADMFAITPSVPYTEDYNMLLDVARQEQNANARPELATRVENWDSYDTVFLGYPDWWSDAPMLIYTFLESYDWTGKVMIPFCTSGGSGFGRSLDNLTASAPGATMLDGLHVQGDDVSNAADEVAAWIDGLDLH